MGTYHKQSLSELDPIIDHHIMKEINKWLIEEHGVYYNKSYELFMDKPDYSLYLHLNNRDRPLILAGQFDSDDKFIDYIKKELNSRKTFWIEYFSLYRTNEKGQV